MQILLTSDLFAENLFQGKHLLQLFLAACQERALRQ